MKQRRRPRSRLFGGFVVLLAASVFTGSAAYADVLPNNPIIPDKSSDPNAWLCYDYNTGQNGICLYTSRDDSPSGWNYNGDNPYPMTKTRLYYLPLGANPGTQSNWQAKGSTVDSVPGVVFQESQYSWVPANAKHLWAPTAFYNSLGKYFLLVPDVSGSNVHTSSRIGVSDSTSPFGPFTYRRRLNLDSGPNSGYASDPSMSYGPLFPWLTYANGDFNNCGKISIAQLSFEMDSVHSGWPKHFAINPATPGPFTLNGVPTGGGGNANLRGCNNNSDYYFEGPELFQRYVSNVGLKYYLMFAVKPASTPPQCTTAMGEPGTANEAIAYAMADDIEGPYTYKGIIMCGSSTEWTNQASIVQAWGPNSSNNLFFYHDGASGGPHTRKVHAECFRFNADGTIPKLTRTSSTSSSRWVGNCWDD
ncbi:hypothetical protein Aph01nite_70260 [Acrocarpospora phusangensis]|uniref:Uncharacterized protein n=1 Tax=Acrocarpospora phusangensis TaxID=1070424 RepID=A0A919QJ02_9ACTN|nr:family 43 glycosylhydrolase [Acrocarpospora phusangensis]GIH28716.1 hypothetical protein Aph01nite_70260 [Acrocarpospora phusangensis]